MLYGLTISAPTENRKKVLTMAEYIKREYAVDAVLDVYYDTPDIDLSGEKFEAAIFKIQAADVAPVRHGRWKERKSLHAEGGIVAKCSACQKDVQYLGNPLKFCPNCGALMDRGCHDGLVYRV